MNRIISSLRKIDVRTCIVNNFWLKLVSLVIAIIIWLYVSGEITKGISI